jgi:hypothetical protein
MEAAVLFETLVTVCVIAGYRFQRDSKFNNDPTSDLHYISRLTPPSGHTPQAERHQL